MKQQQQQGCWHPPAAAAWCLAAVLLLAAALRPAAAALSYDSETDAYGGTLLTPTKGQLNSRRFYWEVPHEPVGVLFMAHGCVHDAADFWPPSDACPECSGLPEEVSHTKQALARGYAVIAVDSKNRAFDNRCFAYEEDKWGVKAVIETWLDEQSLGHLPVFALGVSAGASFALKLPKVTRINGVVSEVLGVTQEYFETPTRLEGTYPPTVFIDMQRDTEMSSRIWQSITVLQSVGVPSARIAVDPRPVPHSFFSDRSEYISPELSRRIVNGLRKIGMLDAAGFVTTDPRYTTQPWKEELAKEVKELQAEVDSEAVPNSEGLAPQTAMIGEQMNLAWAQHEIISDYLTACLAWLEGQGVTPIEKFVAELKLKPKLRDLEPDRQVAPELQDDEAVKAAATQVKEHLAVIEPGDTDFTWGDMYAKYMDWLSRDPQQSNTTFPAWRSKYAPKRWKSDGDDEDGDKQRKKARQEAEEQADKAGRGPGWLARWQQEQVLLAAGGVVAQPAPQAQVLRAPRGGRKQR